MKLEAAGMRILKLAVDPTKTIRGQSIGRQLVITLIEKLQLGHKTYIDPMDARLQSCGPDVFQGSEF